MKEKGERQMKGIKELYRASTGNLLPQTSNDSFNRLKNSLDASLLLSSESC